MKKNIVIIVLVLVSLVSLYFNYQNKENVKQLTLEEATEIYNKTKSFKTDAERKQYLESIFKPSPKISLILNKSKAATPWCKYAEYYAGLEAAAWERGDHELSNAYEEAKDAMIDKCLE